MKRRYFLQTMMWLPLTGKAMNLIDQEIRGEHPNTTSLMPVLFVGHGNPMNALEVNEFSKGWQAVAKTIPTPRAVLCISAHWETNGTLVTSMEKPKTIHDFHGFPDSLFALQYPAPGSPKVAQETTENAGKFTISPDFNWGLDHGCWSVLTHLFPEANIPVIQLSLNYSMTPEGHYDLAKQLAHLRQKGILIVGSGNIVHNLRMLNWKNPDVPFDWASEADTRIKNLIINGNHKDLMNYTSLGKDIQSAIPTPEHFLPMLYAVAMKGKNEKINFFNEKVVMGSISMTSLIIT